MKKYLADTTVLVDHLRSIPYATEFLRKENIVISFVTTAELLQSARNKNEQKSIQKLTSQLEINWGGTQVGKQAIQLLEDYFLKYNLRLLDALIASTALVNNFTLVTGNIKDFHFIKDLKVVNPKIFL